MSDGEIEGTELNIVIQPGPDGAVLLAMVTSGLELPPFVVAKILRHLADSLEEDTFATGEVAPGMPDDEITARVKNVVDAANATDQLPPDMDAELRKITEEGG